MLPVRLVCFKGCSGLEVDFGRSLAFGVLLFRAVA